LDELEADYEAEEEESLGNAPKILGGTSAGSVTL
jgi:hypothetical protein